MKLNYSREELNEAINVIEKLKSTNSIEEYESLWRDFLNYIEKCWIKAERECQSVKNQFLPWQGKFKNLRKNDPLLKYLKNARDADVHTVQEIVDKRRSQLKSIRFANPKPINMMNRIVIKDGILENYDGGDIIAEFDQGYVKAKTFTSNNQIYTIPFFHRGKKIANPNNPIELAKLAINFYSDFLDQIEEKF